MISGFFGNFFARISLPERFTERIIQIERDNAFEAKELEALRCELQPRRAAPRPIAGARMQHAHGGRGLGWTRGYASAGTSEREKERKREEE